MAVREIRTYPDDVLRVKAEPVEAVDAEVRQLMDDLVATMHASAGIGLAAPQVGVSKRVIVLHVKMDDLDHPLTVLANPEIVEGSGEIEFEEGCLSLPGFNVWIDRFSHVKVKGTDREGTEVELEADGLFAVALQHEIDHLEGKLIIDSASPIKRAFYSKSVKKQMAKAGQL
ncbi:MAG: peptide deformylase [Thermodesulfovibrionales bacterium]|nr:peptide deformylase [Thermodesulfovibrionales bacterium]